MSGGMGAGGETPYLRRLVGFLSLLVGSLALANCSSNVAGKVDPRYGVASSARVVEPGRPVPKGGGVYRVGKPYTVAGHTYTPEENSKYSAVGLASWYGDKFHGRYTANGEIYDQNGISAAHPTLPLPSYARVTNLQNHRSIVVRVNDRGPYVGNRLIDVSVRTAKLLGFYGDGVTKVKVEYVGRAPLRGSDDRKLAGTLRNNVSGSGVQVAAANSFAPTYFDARPTKVAVPQSAPVPPSRPYLAERGVSTQQASIQTSERPAAEPEQAVDVADTRRPQEAAPRLSAVSAYATVRYDGAVGFISGRGLY
jgi:rare lipoprotein A